MPLSADPRIIAASPGARWAADSVPHPCPNTPRTVRSRRSVVGTWNRRTHWDITDFRIHRDPPNPTRNPGNGSCSFPPVHGVSARRRRLPFAPPVVVCRRSDRNRAESSRDGKLRLQEPVLPIRGHQPSPSGRDRLNERGLAGAIRPDDDRDARVQFQASLSELRHSRNSPWPPSWHRVTRVHSDPADGDPGLSAGHLRNCAVPLPSTRPEKDMAAATNAVERRWATRRPVTRPARSGAPRGR